MAAAPVGFSWVNYTSAGVVEREEEDASIIKSLAMRMRLQPTPRKRPTSQAANHLHKELHAVACCSKTDWEKVAICQFLEAFVYPEQSSPVIAFQYFSFLPGLYGKYSAQSCLTEAILAVALARLANQNWAADLSLRARKAYENALRLVNQSMSKPEMRKTDEVLTALSLLMKYELVSGDGIESLFEVHDKGQAALIKERDAEWLRSDVGASLFRLLYVRHLLTCVARSERPAIVLGRRSRDLVFPAPYLRDLMELTRKIADLRCGATT